MIHLLSITFIIGELKANMNLDAAPLRLVYFYRINSGLSLLSAFVVSSIPLDANIGFAQYESLVDACRTIQSDLRLSKCSDPQLIIGINSKPAFPVNARGSSVAFEVDRIDFVFTKEPVELVSCVS